MRILRIEAEGIFLFEGKAVIDFNAEQRVYPDNAAMLYNPFGNTYTNNVLSFVGVNASGKTTILKLISFVMSLLNAEAINTIDTKVILEKSTKVVLKTYFYDEKAGVCLLETVIGVTKEEGAVDRYTILHERLYIRKAGSITSKANLFQKYKEPISMRGIQNISHYLSSGTIKGLNVFMQAWMTLIKGGYFLVDEIENHFNKEIVATLIRFFMDEKVNKRGATLIYSTHYVELLDELDRNDGIYVTRNNDGISIQKLHHILKRNDIKKSDVFQSGMLEGTVPSYEASMRLKKTLASGTIVEDNK